jgi:hypothetical protein
MTNGNHRRSRMMSLIAACGLMLASAGSVGAADMSYGGEAVNQRVDKTWEFLIAPYFVGANITGTSQVGRLPATDIDIGTDDILKNLHFGGMVRAEALFQQKYGAILDIAYMKLGNSNSTPLTGGRIRLGVRQLIAEAMLSYRAYRTPRSFIDLYAGGRYWDITLDLNASGTIAGNFIIKRGDNWLDPVIGIRGLHRINDKWSVNARADIGGFGVGSDFSWNAQAGVGYHFNRTWSAHLQYKALMVDYANGKAGTASFAYDTITHGPLLGIAARF